MGDVVEPRRVGWGAIIAVLAAWLVAGILGAVVGGALTGSTDDPYSEAGLLLGHIALPAAAGLAVTAGAVSLLRRWPDVLRERLPMRSWAWALPGAMAVAAAAFADWSRVAAVGAALVVALVATALVVAASEELLFRGLLLTGMRDHLHELAAALVSSLLFAAMHMVVAGGLTDIVQGVSTFLGGIVYYVARRVSGGLVVPVLLHAWWDICAFSAVLGPGPDSDHRAFESLLVLLVLGVVALAAWKPLNRLPDHDRAGA